MDNFFTQIFNILVSQPGNLVYHLILAFLVAASLQMALMAYRSGISPVSGRLVLGLSLILVAQMALFISTGLAWQGVADPHSYMPPLDRAITTFSLIWVIWLWAFPTANRLVDALAGVLTIAVIVMGLFTLNLWGQASPSLAFNDSSYEWGWSLAGLILTFLGLMVLFIKRPSFWGTGLASLGLLLAGYVANLLILEPNSDYSGILRLAGLTAYPLLPVLSQRLTATLLSAPAEPGETTETRSGPDPRLVQAWMTAAAEMEPDRLYPALARAVAQTMRADLCLILKMTGETLPLDVIGGYDLVKGEAIETTSLLPDSIPTLSSAMQRGRPIRMSPGLNHSNDLVELGKTIGLDEAGSLQAVPLIYRGKVWGGVVLLSPYANREWSDEEQNFLTAAADALMAILLRVELPSLSQDAATQLRGELDGLRQENEQLIAHVKALTQENQALKSTSEMESLLAVQKEAQDTIAQLQTENERLQQAVESGSGGNGSRQEIEQMEGDLRLLLQEIALLKNQLAEANMRLEEARHRKPEEIAGEAQHTVIAMTQDLRQPVTALVGYTDLLLAESAGPLSAGQRVFLERVKSAVERLRSLVDDLVRAANLAAGPLALSLQPVDVIAVVDEAVAANTALLREKNITLRPDLPEELPALQADALALRQILVDLLRNAALTSQPDGTILLYARPYAENGREYLLFQVTDHGGGLSAADLPDLFKARPFAVQPLAAGTGDTGCGLSIVEALVKAQHGQIAVTSQPGDTVTYTMRFPLLSQPSQDSPEPV